MMQKTGHQKDAAGHHRKVQQLEQCPLDTLDGKGGDAQHHQAHVADAREGQHASKVGLGEGEQGAVEDTHHPQTG